MTFDLPELGVETITAAAAENITGPVCIAAAIFLYVAAETTIIV